MCNPTPHPDLELGSSSHAEEEEFTLFVPKPQQSSSPSPSKIRDAPPTDSGFASKLLDGVSPAQQMMILSFAMFLFFGAHNILQEAIVNLLSNDGMKEKGTLMLGYAEVIGVLSFSYLERTYMTDEGGFDRVAPLSAYPMLTMCLFASSTLCNFSLSFINFPTKVVFRSCKLVPTMLIATCVNQKVFASYEYLCALCICAGLVLFAMADYSLDPIQFNPMGLILVSGSVVADSILPNAQEHLFRDGSSRLEVTVYSNLFSFIGMTVVTLMNGSLLTFIRGVAADSQLATYFAVYTVLSYISISCYMTLVKRFGGVTAVMLTTARKAMTIILSFMLFPKGFSWLYVYGSLLVLGAVMMAGICKRLKKRNQKQRTQEYSLSYRDTEKDANSQASGFTADLSNEDSTMESSPEQILESITRRAYV